MPFSEDFKARQLTEWYLHGARQECTLQLVPSDSDSDIDAETSRGVWPLEVLTPMFGSISNATPSLA